MGWYKGKHSKETTSGQPLCKWQVKMMNIQWFYGHLTYNITTWL
jgi:hypothetical protein